MQQPRLTRGTQVAKKGNKVSMRYIGKLTNGKVFDKNTKGDPFKFNLGAGEGSFRSWMPRSSSRADGS
jgi:FKBP-type peptidyl-prolyl cis-trans isomerase